MRQTSKTSRRAVEFSRNRAILNSAPLIAAIEQRRTALDRMRGHYALNNAPQPHWKYFWFD